MSTDEQDLLSGGLPSLKFEKIGDTHTGIVTDVKKQEDRDPEGNKKLWPSGDVKHVYVLTLRTDGGETSNIWARGLMIQAIREAAKTAGVTELVGNKIAVKYTGDGEPSKKGYHAPKQFAAKVEKLVTDDKW